MKRVESKEGSSPENFISLPDSLRETLKELMVCDLCKTSEFHPPLHRKWGKERKKWLEWDEEKSSLYWTVVQKTHLEVWQWEYRPEENLIGLEILFVSSPPFDLSVGEIIFEGQIQEVSRKIDLRNPDKKYRYMKSFLDRENQEKILSSLLSGFSL